MFKNIPSRRIKNTLVREFDVNQKTDTNKINNVFVPPSRSKTLITPSLKKKYFSNNQAITWEFLSVGMTCKFIHVLSALFRFFSLKYNSKKQ